MIREFENLKKNLKKYKFIHTGCMDYLKYLLLSEDPNLYRPADELSEEPVETRSLKPLFYRVTRHAITKQEIEEVCSINDHSTLNSTDYAPMITSYFYIKDEDCLMIASSLVDQRGLSTWDVFIKCLFILDESRDNYFHVWKLLKERYPSFFLPRS